MSCVCPNKFSYSKFLISHILNSLFSLFSLILLFYAWTNALEFWNSIFQIVFWKSWNSINSGYSINSGNCLISWCSSDSNYEIISWCSSDSNPRHIFIFLYSKCNFQIEWVLNTHGYFEIALGQGKITKWVLVKLSFSIVCVN